LDFDFPLRRKRLLSEINGSAAILFSPEAKVASADTHFPFLQDSNFYYLTGISQPNTALVMLGRSSGVKTILFAPEHDPVRSRWEGDLKTVRDFKRSKDFDQVLPISTLDQELPKLLTGCETIFSTFGISDPWDKRLLAALSSPWGPRPDRPSGFADIRHLLSRYRLKKDSKEIKCVKRAVHISMESFLETMLRIKEFSNELHCARELEASFSARGSERPAFNTIVAGGANAACLHHTPGKSKIKNNSLVLVDAGASLEGYSSDLTRTFPKSGRFTEAQAGLYDVVYKAHQAALKQSRPGSSLKKIHAAAVREITKGLIDIGLIKGRLDSALKKKKFRQFYMHNTSHWMGLDVHDCAPFDYKKPFEIERSQEQDLKPGNIFTVEPGIYIDGKDKSVPAEFRGIGIRLENDILITSGGHINLSEDLPLKRDDVECLLL